MPGKLAASMAVVAALAMAVVTLLSAGGQAAGLVGDPVLVGAGDIASCSSSGDEATANLLEGIDGTIAALGDNAYDKGTIAEYQDCYGPSWGRHVGDGQQNLLARTKPSVGNHEYETAGASGYFQYFGDAASPTEPGCRADCKGYYSYDLGDWHVVVLNSNCTKVAGGCGAGSPQERWLRNDLADHTNACTAAYFHHPRFSSSGVGSNSAVAPFWQALYDADAEVVLNGHAHNYERFAPLNPSGQLDQEKGIREFIVGTGGRSLNKFGTVRKYSQMRMNGAYGVIKLTLHPNSYDWEFVPEAGKPSFTDSGSGSCHGGSGPPPPTNDTTPPTVTSTVPTSGAPQVAPTAEVTATFSEAMDTSLIDGTTFKLRVKGSTTNLPADISYDPATRTATLTPTDPLGNGITYKAIVTTGAKDLAGNRLDQNGTSTGSQQKAWLFTVGN